MGLILWILRQFTLKTVVFTLVVLVVVQPSRAFDFSEWEVLLKNHVSPKIISGVRLNAVDYKKIQTNGAFKKLLIDLENFSPGQLKSKQDKLAFWINVYNIMAVKMVLSHYPIKSIKDAGSLFGSVWEKKVGMVGGKYQTLNQIEHDILRKMNEPRIHVAIVCASVSCPDLRKEAYVTNQLDFQLNDQMKSFLENSNKGFRIENGKIYLSSIFKWFKKDFESRGGVLPFIRSYVGRKERDVIVSSQPKIAYMNYDWGLNIR